MTIIDKVLIGVIILAIIFFASKKIFSRADALWPVVITLGTLFLSFYLFLVAHRFGWQIG